MIKRISLIVLAILVICGMALAATPGSRQDPGPGDILGQGKYPSDAHRIFRLVRFVGATSGASGLDADSLVIWDLTADDGVTIATTTTSSDSAVAGILKTNILTQDTTFQSDAATDIGHRNWGWLQTYGKAQVNLVASLGNLDQAGQAFGTSTTAGEAAMFVGSTTNPKLKGMAGFFYDTATAGDDDVECFLKGLD